MADGKMEGRADDARGKAAGAGDPVERSIGDPAMAAVGTHVSGPSIIKPRSS
jgi:hypothetical protein